MLSTLNAQFDAIFGKQTIIPVQAQVSDDSYDAEEDEDLLDDWEEDEDDFEPDWEEDYSDEDD